MRLKHAVIPIFIPHKGCPFDCIFCNQKRISGQLEEMTLDKMHNIIREHLQTLDRDTFVEIGFYGGSFTGLPLALQESYLQAVSPYIREGRVRHIKLSTRPDYITEDILDLLAAYNVRTIELGVQSLDEEVLRQSCRGHSAEDVYKACSLIGQYKITLGIQTMIGLPGDSREKDLQTAQAIAALSPQLARIYPTLVIRNTYLEKMYQEGRYKPLELEEAVDTCAGMLEIFETHHIQVIRVGLQPTENISSGADVIAGPFHPAFRQLVESRRMLHRMEAAIQEQKLQGEQVFTYRVPSGRVSDAVGQKRCNVEYLKRKYGFRNIVIEQEKG